MKANYSSFRVLALLVATMIGASLLLSVLFLFYFSSLASAQTTLTTIKVTTKADEDNTDGDCSLREAIEAANTNSAVDGCAAGSDTEQDTILFSLEDKATIKLVGSQLPTITDDAGLLIDGKKAKITVSGQDLVRVFEVGTGGKLDLNRLRVADGATGGSGGGIFINGGEAKVSNSTFFSNSAGQFGGGIDNRGTLEVINSTFYGNSASTGGGGIDNFGTLTVTNSTFSGNGASFGGGIANGGTLTVTNSTFSKNSANVRGGGILNAAGTTTLKNTIVANSTQGGNCANISGTITDGGYNIEDGTSCGFSAANNSLPSTEPKLAKSLAKNGGPTKTIALLKGSPALNAIPQGTNGCGTENTTDQRGVSRPQGEGCDIGAFEKKVRRR